MADNKSVPVTQETRHADEQQRYTDGNGNYWTPPVDIYETKDGIHILADLPGVEKGDVDLNVEHNLLTITARTTELPERTNVYSEYETRNYRRQFRIGDEVNQDRIDAELKNGVLRVHLPKAEKVKPKQIKVNVN